MCRRIFHGEPRPCLHHNRVALGLADLQTRVAVPFAVRVVDAIVVDANGLPLFAP